LLLISHPCELSHSCQTIAFSRGKSGRLINAARKTSNKREP
jgi:hypothetical protein